MSLVQFQSVLPPVSVCWGPTHHVMTLGRTLFSAEAVGNHVMMASERVADREADGVSKDYKWAFFHSLERSGLKWRR